MSQKTLICDFDGTLFNSQDWTVGAALHSTKLCRLMVSRDEIMANFLKGTPLREFYGALVAKTEIPVERCIAAHRDYQSRPDVVASITPYPDVLETLRKINDAGVKLAIATSRLNRAPLLRVLERFSVSQFFGAIVCLEDVKNAKPDPESIFLAMDLLDAKPEDTFFVGDTHSDMRTGVAANVRTIGALYGFIGEALRDEGADHFISKFSEVLQIVTA